MKKIVIFVWTKSPFQSTNFYRCYHFFLHHHIFFPLLFFIHRNESRAKRLKYISFWPDKREMKAAEKGNDRERERKGTQLRICWVEIYEWYFRLPWINVDYVLNELRRNYEWNAMWMKIFSSKSINETIHKMKRLLLLLLIDRWSKCFHWKLLSWIAIHLSRFTSTRIYWLRCCSLMVRLFSVSRFVFVNLWFMWHFYRHDCNHSGLLRNV